MKINRQKNITNDLPAFEDLETGATFMGRPSFNSCYDGREIFMKLDRDDGNVSVDCDEGIAVNLETGEIQAFFLTTTVVRVEASLNVG